MHSTIRRSVTILLKYRLTGCQLASASGAIVIATSSSDSKLKLAQAMGAKHTINYNTNPDWAEEVLRITEGRGVYHVLDVGGASTIEQSLQATRQAGFVSLIGFLSEPKKYDIVPAMLFGAKTLRGVFQIRKDMLEKALSVYDEYDLHPQIAQVFEWEDAKAAFEALCNKSQVGKIVVRVGKD
jgi:NADPH:quinone reductase-like Zn-dependent oxidoreductase